MTEVRNDRRRRTGGPPLVLVASVSAALAVAAVVIQNALTGGDAYPRPFTGTSTINDYFAVHGEVAQVAGTLQFAAAVPLAISQRPHTRRCAAWASGSPASRSR